MIKFITTTTIVYFHLKSNFYNINVPFVFIFYIILSVLYDDRYIILQKSKVNFYTNWKQNAFATLISEKVAGAVSSMYYAEWWRNHASRL